MLGDIVIPDQQYILIDISSDIGMIQVQAQKTYHYETKSNHRHASNKSQNQFQYCYGFEFLFQNMSTQRRMEELINNLDD